MANLPSPAKPVGKGHVLPTTHLRVPMPKVSPPRPPRESRAAEPKR